MGPVFRQSIRVNIQYYLFIPHIVRNYAFDVGSYVRSYTVNHIPAIVE